MDWVQALIGLVVYAVVKWWEVPVYIAAGLLVARGIQGAIDRHEMLRADRVKEERAFQRSLVRSLVLEIRNLAHNLPMDLVDPDVLKARRAHTDELSELEEE